jgi:ActR/RegA family two-component response regulator
MEKEAVILLHRDDDQFLVTEFLEDRFTVRIASSIDEAIDLVTTKNIAYVVMDLNYGSPSSQDITPARKIYSVVKDREQVGKLKFIGLSGHDKTVALAKAERIPAYIKGVSLHQLLEGEEEKK